jgi:acetyl-CoA carboxylase carboxyl transferase subunit beta
MQMPRTIIAAEMVKAAKLPYLVLLTNPTTGGVSASFAMVGDIHMAEPGCTIGFAGKRVIQETIREDLPEGFQTAEYLIDHGMVDMVVHRKDLPSTIGRLLDLLKNKNTSAKGKSVKPSKSNATKAAKAAKSATTSAKKAEKTKVEAKKADKKSDKDIKLAAE